MYTYKKIRKKRSKKISAEQRDLPEEYPRPIRNPDNSVHGNFFSDFLRVFYV